MPEKNLLNEKVTLIAKTFERPKCVKRMIESVRKFYPDIRLIIVDDSKEPEPLDDCEYLILPYDSGVSAGRNYALKHVETPYFVTLDDDFVFTEDTKLELWLDILEENPGLDLVAGMAGNLHWAGGISTQGGVFSLTSGPVGELNGFNLYDIVVQFFMARLDKVLAFGAWDEDYKTGVEHRDFFFRAKGKLKITLCTDVKCIHTRNFTYSREYTEKRCRAKSTIDLFLKKHGLKEMRIF